MQRSHTEPHCSHWEYVNAFLSLHYCQFNVRGFKIFFEPSQNSTHSKMKDAWYAYWLFWVHFFKLKNLFGISLQSRIRTLLRRCRSEIFLFSLHLYVLLSECVSTPKAFLILAVRGKEKLNLVKRRIEQGTCQIWGDLSKQSITQSKAKSLPFMSFLSLSPCFSDPTFLPLYLSCQICTVLSVPQ